MRSWSRGRICAGAVLTVILSAGALGAQSLESRLQSAESALRNAVRSLAQATDTGNVNGVSDVVADLEDLLSDLRVIRRTTFQERTRLERRFYDQNRDFSQLLGILLSLDAAPAPGFLLHPDGPEGAAQASIMIADITPKLERQSKALADRVQAWRDLAALETRIAQIVSQTLSEYKLARGTLRASGEGPAQNIVSDRERLEALRSLSGDLEAFAEGLNDIPLADIGQETDFASVKGTLPWPVTGAVGDYPARFPGGVLRTGVHVKAPPLSLVSAPMAGTVRFAGSFMNLGQVVILEPADDNLLILAQLGDVTVVEGDILKADDPIGLMGAVTPLDPQVFIVQEDSEDDYEDDAGVSNTLYVEVRIDGEAVDPRDYFADPSL